MDLLKDILLIDCNLCVLMNILMTGTILIMIIIFVKNANMDIHLDGFMKGLFG